MTIDTDFEVIKTIPFSKSLVFHTSTFRLMIAYYFDIFISIVTFHKG